MLEVGERLLHPRSRGNRELYELLREGHVLMQLVRVVAHVNEGSEEVGREEPAKDLAVTLRREDETQRTEGVGRQAFARDEAVGGVGTVGSPVRSAAAALALAVAARAPAAAATLMLLEQ